MTIDKTNFPGPEGENPENIEEVNSPETIIAEISESTESIESTASSVEAFDLFLKQDLRISTSLLDKRSQVTLERLQNQLILWRNVAGASSSYIKGKANNLSIPYRVTIVALLPAFGYVISQYYDPRAKHHFDHRLPTAFPISSIFLQRPIPNAWDTFEYSQFCNSINWKSVKYSNYQNDSTFVLFQPELTFQLKGQYLGEIHTQPSGQIIDLEKDASGCYSSRQPKIAQTIYSLVGKRQSRLVQKLLLKKFAQKPLNVVKSIQNEKPLWEVKYPLQESERLDLKRNLLKSMGRSTSDKSNWYFKRMSTQKGYTPVSEIKIVTTWDYHLLYNSKTIAKTNQQLRACWFTKRHTRPRIKNIQAQYYWQTYFNAFDLLPLKMESTNNLNKEEERNFPLTKRDKRNQQKDKKNHRKAMKTNAQMRKFYITSIKRYKRKIENEEKAMKKSPILAAAVQRNRTVEKEETAFDEFDARYEPIIEDSFINAQKRILFQPGRNCLTLTQKDQFNSINITNKEMDAQTSLFDVNSKKKRNLPPLFNVVHIKNKPNRSGELSSKKRKYHFSQPLQTPKRVQEPKTKIDLLTHCIQFELTQSLSPNLAFRQSTRYQIYNSLFRFKKLMGNQMNCISADAPFFPKPLLSDGKILRPKTHLRTTNKRIDLHEPTLYSYLIVDSTYFKTQSLKPTRTKNLGVEKDRFYFDRRLNQFSRRLMFNNHRVIPMTQKNWFMDIKDQLLKLDCYKDYRNFYEHFFIKNSIVSPSSFILDDIIQENEKEKFTKKTRFSKGVKLLTNQRQSTILRSEPLDPLKKAKIDLLATKFVDELAEHNFVENLTEYMNDHWIDLWETTRQTAFKVKPITRTQAKEYLNGKMLREQLRLNKKLVQKYQRTLRQRHNKKKLNETKKEIRKRVIEGQSPFLQRQFSGYLSPDASFKEKYMELMAWDNLFQNSQFVNKFNKKSPFKLNFSQNSFHSPLYQIYGLSQQNYTNFQRLMSTNHLTPFNFNTFKKLKINQANVFDRPDNTNFYGRTITDYGLTFKRVFDFVGVELDDLPYVVDWEKAVENKNIINQDEEGSAHLPYAPSRGIRLRNNKRWVNENRPGHTVYRQIRNKATRSPQGLIEKAIDQTTTRPYPTADLSTMSEKSENWHIYGGSYLGMQEPVSTFLLNLNDQKTGTTYRLFTTIVSPRYVTLVIFSYYVFKALKRIDIDYRRSVLIGVQDFLNKLDSSSMKKVFEVNKAVVECNDVSFDGIVGGARILNLFYPLILSVRTRRYAFGSLPVSSFHLLQTLASSTVELKIDADDDRIQYNVSAPFKTAYEAAVASRFQSQVLSQKDYNEMGYLLIGPPGTGKTYLVKALAGESMVPVIIPSKYTLAVQTQSAVDSPLQNKDDVLKIRQLFELAETRKPCILFLDEVDALGPDRQDVLVDTKSGKTIGPDFLLNPSPLVKNKAFDTWRKNGFIDTETLNLDRNTAQYWTTYNPIQAIKDLSETLTDTSAHIGSIEAPKPDKQPEKKGMTREALANLTQLLCSLDGLNENKILVVAATNRPNALDPALIRPGRLHKIIYLDLPQKQKRLDLLKFYSRSRITENIDWDYFSKQTVGLSPAHLKAAMNLSALQTAYQAIKKQNVSSWSNQPLMHTQKTIEYGIQSIKDSGTFLKGYFKSRSGLINRIVLPDFFDTVYCFENWAHISLGSPTKPIVLNPSKLPLLAMGEKLPAKNDTNVWNGMPNHIPRCSIKELYSGVEKVILQPVGKDGVQRTLIRKTKSKLTKEQRQEGRHQFFLRHRKALRTAYLFSAPSIINYSLLKNTKLSDHPFIEGFSNSGLLDEKSASILQLFHDYVKEVFKVHLFGSKLLLNSTYFVNNPLSFSTQYLYKKENKTLIRSGAQFAGFSLGHTKLIVTLLMKEKPTLFITTKQIDKKFQKLFANPLTLHRSLAYSANKAILVHFLTDSYEQEHMYDIWGRCKLETDPKKYQKIFVKALKENFIHRKQFENYLLALTAGKVGEHLMLYYRNALPTFDPLKPRSGRYTYDVSEIGRQELHQISWLLNIMIEKNLFYDPNVDLSKQVITSENSTRAIGKVDASVVAIASNKERWVEFDKKTSRLMHKFDKNRLLKKLVSLLIPQHSTYWWEPEGLDLGSPGKLNTINSWTSLFSSKKQIKLQRMPENLNYDTYRPNILKTESLLDAPFDAKYLPPEFVKAATKLSTSWNQGKRSETERLTRALLLDAFAKTAYILVGQRELCDYLSYYLLLNGKMQSNALKELSHKFLEPTEKDRLLRVQEQEKIAQEKREIEQEKMAQEKQKQEKSDTEQEKVNTEQEKSDTESE